MSAPARIAVALAGHMRFVWLNIGLSLVTGFAAVALGYWAGESLL